MSRLTVRIGLSAATALSLALGYVTVHRDDGARATRALGVPFPAVMAHRGESYLAPEETALAYRLAA